MSPESLPIDQHLSIDDSFDKLNLMENPPEKINIPTAEIGDQMLKRICQEAKRAQIYY